MANDDEGDKGTPWYVIVANFLLFTLVFGIAASVEIKQLARQFRHKAGLVTGLCCQFVLLPFMGFLTVKTFNLKPITGIPLLVVCSSPGGSYSNLWCSMFNTDLALSVAMTTVSTIMSTGMLPFNLWLYVTQVYGANAGINWAGLFIPIAMTIFAISSGLLASHFIGSSDYDEKHHKLRNKFNKIGNYAGITLIVFSVLMPFITKTAGCDGSNLPDSCNTTRGDVDGDDDQIIRPWWFYICVTCPCVMGILAALLVSSMPCLGLSKPERSSICVECCYQNTGLAQAVALTMFSAEEAADAIMVPLIYGAAEIIIIGIFCFCAWQANWTYASRNEPFCGPKGVLLGNFQNVPNERRKRNWSVAHIADVMEKEVIQDVQASAKSPEDAEGVIIDGPLPSAMAVPDFVGDGKRKSQTPAEPASDGPNSTTRGASMDLELRDPAASI